MDTGGNPISQVNHPSWQFMLEKKRPLKARFLFKIADSWIYSLSLSLSLSQKERKKDCLNGEEELHKNENGSSLEPADKLWSERDWNRR
jgi:hypothetical protein